MTDALTTCAAIQEQLTALADEELSEAATDVVRAHLATCAECAARFAELGQLKTVVPEWRVNVPEVTEIVMQAVRTETQGRKLLESSGGTPTEMMARAETQVARAKAELENLPFIDLTRHRPEPAAIATVPGEVARRRRLIPVRKDGQTLYVAMENPRDVSALDEIRAVSRCAVIRPMLAVPTVLEEALRTAYGPKPSPIEPPHRAAALTAAESSASEFAQTAILSSLVDELRGLREEVRAAREEIAGLRAEVSELRRRANTPTTTVSRYMEVSQLLPYAPPSDTPTPLG